MLCCICSAAAPAVLCNSRDQPRSNSQSITHSLASSYHHSLYHSVTHLLAHSPITSFQLPLTNSSTDSTHSSVNSTQLRVASLPPSPATSERSHKLKSLPQAAPPPLQPLNKLLLLDICPCPSMRHSDHHSHEHSPPKGRRHDP